MEEAKAKCIAVHTGVPPSEVFVPVIAADGHADAGFEKDAQGLGLIAVYGGHDRTPLELAISTPGTDTLADEPVEKVTVSSPGGYHERVRAASVLVKPGPQVNIPLSD
ncbi:hypothetical protein PG985_008873 [Apiospora marii]|uniref:Uncharacterized protein n=1 Tax=Apiospora marii TaxID=335849 RepID=A0ABR1RCD9_9PEZI